MEQKLAIALSKSTEYTIKDLFQYFDIGELLFKLTNKKDYRFACMVLRVAKKFNIRINFNTLYDQSILPKHGIFTRACFYKNVKLVKRMIRHTIVNKEINIHCKDEAPFLYLLQTSVKTIRWFMKMSKFYSGEKVDIRINNDKFFRMCTVTQSIKKDIIKELISMCEEYSMLNIRGNVLFFTSRFVLIDYLLNIRNLEGIKRMFSGKEKCEICDTTENIIFHKNHFVCEKCISKTPSQNICFICRNVSLFIRFTCGHYICILCFCSWFKEHISKCLVCEKDIKLFESTFVYNNILPVYTTSDQMHITGV